MRTRVKICCIASAEEARTAIRHGADALGLVGPMPSGPGAIDLDAIARIVRSIPPPVASFLLSSETNADALIAQARRCAPTALQMVDAVDGPATYIELKRACPGMKLVQVIYVTGPDSVREAREAAAHVDLLVLDTGSFDSSVKRLGNTGRTHDWKTSAEIVKAVRVPAFLAGGLTPENAREAIAKVSPYGLDLCTNVRCEGALDEARLSAFMHSVQYA